MNDDRSLSRRDLLRGKLFRRLASDATHVAGAVHDALKPTPSTGLGAAATSMHDDGPRNSAPIHRPPGALNEAAFLSACTRCDACINACPVKAIVRAPRQMRGAAGSPIIDPATSPCVMCADTPCIAACQPRALRVEQPRKMGVAWLSTMNCLAHQRSFCTVCSERCPVDGAITVRAGKPTVNESACTGCGVCASVCPAPQNAIVIMPLIDRPSCDDSRTR